MDPELPPSLRFLKTLVTVLTGVMILGLITVLFLLVTRLPGAAISAPEELALPTGTEVVAITRAPNYWLVTTRDDRLLIFDADGTFRRQIPLTE